MWDGAWRRPAHVSRLRAAGRTPGLPRWFDLALGGLGLLLLAVPMALCAVLVRATSPGPVFYRHLRTGQNGRPIRVWKFRTMRAGADRAGPAITRGGDPRVTPVGRWLRAAKIDEWPQLFNVLAGDMAWVGPRPEVAEFVQAYPAEYQRLLEFRPGITDPASLEFVDEEQRLASAGEAWRQCYLEEILPRKLQLASDYARRRTWHSDLAVLGATALHLMRRSPTPAAKEV